MHDLEIANRKKKVGRRDNTVSLINSQFINTKLEPADEGRKRAG